MNQLIATLLDCPNLSLRVLDPNGRAIKILSQDEFRLYFHKSTPACAQSGTQAVGEPHPDQLN